MCVLDKLCLNITVCEVGRDGMFFLDCYFRSSVSDRWLPIFKISVFLKVWVYSHKDTWRESGRKWRQSKVFGLSCSLSGLTEQGFSWRQGCCGFEHFSAGRKWAVEGVPRQEAWLSACNPPPLSPSPPPLQRQPQWPCLLCLTSALTGLLHSQPARFLFSFLPPSHRCLPFL